MSIRKLDALKESFNFYLKILCGSYGWNKDDIEFNGTIVNHKTGETAYVNWKKPD